MSLKFQRFEPPPEGKTLLLGLNQIWKDPRKPENQPQPKLESEKGVYLPSWTNIIGATAFVSILATFNHYKLRAKW